MRKKCLAILCLAVVVLPAISFGVAAQLLTGPAQLERCDEGTFTIAFTNPSPTQTACQMVVRNTSPSAEFTYISGSGAVTIPGYGTLPADPIAGSWNLDAIAGSSVQLAPGGTVSVQFRLATTCLAVSGTDAARVDYVHCTQPGTPLQVTEAVSVEILPGALTLAKTPANPAAGVGDLVTWTLTVNSTGLGSIKNVAVTDSLGSGLEFVSATPTGQVSGQTVVWTPLDVPALADIYPDSSVTMTLVARVVACTNLDNRLDGRFGCSDVVVCGDTVTDLGDCGSAPVSSVQFIQRLPFLEFSAPSISIPYCAATTTVTIPIENTGDGTAHDAVLCPSTLGGLVVSNVQNGATYSGGCFRLPDVPGGATFNLVFDVTFAGDWCTSTPNASPLYTLEYANDCGVTHRATPRFGSIGTSASPGLSVSKSGPSIVKYGSQVTYNITATYSGPATCGSSTTGIVTVTDHLPSGFIVVASAGGTWAPEDGGRGGTVTWTFDPKVSQSAGWFLIVQVPLDCAFCYTERTNTVSATAVSCCGCVLSASSSTTMAITCERLYTSTFAVTPTSVLERCGDAATVSDVHVFADDSGLDAITFSQFVYRFIKANGLVYVPGSVAATIDGTPVTPVGVTDGATEVQFTVTDPRSVRGHTLTFTYGVRSASASAPVCGSSSSFYVWASHEIPTIGPCTRFYDTQLLTIQPPSMSVSISGVPTIQEDCATYEVTLTFRRTSALADPYDARFVLTGTSTVIANFAGATWTGVTPSESPIALLDRVEWRFADGFAVPGATATLTVPVTAKCGRQLIELGATGTFDDLCNNIDGYSDTCSTSASASSSLQLTGGVYISKTPEVIYTTQRSVVWRLELYNSSNGTAYNVYVDDVLGAGLVYSSASVSGLTGTMTTTANRDHTGAVTNGATFLLDHIDPGERPVITFTADLVACNNMTNQVTVGWGCGGSECQTPRSDSAYVLTAPANVVSTSLAPTPIDACTTQKATITLRSAGIATAYNLSAAATLPTGLVYVGNPEYRVSGGAWLATGAPIGAPGPTLRWTKTQIPALAAVAPGVTIDVRFDVEATCSFEGGTLQAQTSYENPCGQTYLSAVGSFAIASRRPTLSVTATQTSPAAGQPIACGANVTWEIRVTNSGPAAAEAVWIETTLGAGLTYVSSTGGADNGANSGQTVRWEIVNLGVGSTSVLTVTAQASSCNPLTADVRAYWACGPDGSSATTPDCLSSTYATASATAVRTVTVSASAALSPTSIGSCESGTTLTLTLTNTSTSAPAYSPDAKVTLPSGLSYRAGTTEIDCGSGFAPAADPAQAGQVLTWYNTAATGVGNDLCSSIPAGGSVAVRFQVAAACYRTTASATIDLYYYDCCGGTQYHPTSTASLTAASPTLSVSMTPSTATLDCANPSNTVTWTIAVQNTGTSTAGFVRVIDTLGADLVRVSGGTQIGANPLQWGWEFGPLAPGGSQSVQLVVRLAVPPNDCTVARRTSTAVTSWGCTLAAPDGDPNTTAEYSCTSSGGSVTRTATVLVPDLSISSSDLAPQFTCSGDGISNGRMLLTVRNTGTAAITGDFSISFSESTTGWSGAGTFTSLGGTLPLAAGGSQTLTFSNWPIACSSCSYTFTATLDTGSAICECRENNNTASLSYTPTSPDLTVASSTLAPNCAGDGQVRIQGNVTLRNQGCGSSAFTTNIPMRFTVYAGPSCSGTVLDQWTQTFTGVSIAAGGGTQAFAVDRTATYSACSPCQISILIEADHTNAICECSGTNNTFCAGPLSIAFPDLVVSGISFAGLACASDAISGSVAVTITNQGCGAAGAFNVGLATGGCLAFASQRVTSLGAGASVVVQFPVVGAWTGCGTCVCTFTATVDTGNEVCKCSGGNNTGTASYTSSLPDLVITSFTASAPSPCLPGSASVTVRNSGCGTAPAGVVVGIAGAATGQAMTTVALAAGASQTITVPFDAPVGCGTGYAVTATVDPASAVCECTGANNTASTTFSVSAPDFAVSNANATCNLDDTFAVTANIQNVGGQPATAVSIRVYVDGTLVHDETQSIAAGATHSLSYVTPPFLCATPHAIRVVADETGAICECSETNNEATIAAALCTCPALTTAKSITNVWRGGVSVWPASAVESGDVIEYRTTITNNGTAIAFHVDLTDALPDGLLYSTSAPGHGGQYTLSAGGSGTFAVPVGGSTFATSIHATLAIGASLTISYCARAQSTIEQGGTLTNIVTGDGQEGSGRDIPAGGSSATLTANRPALSVDKTIVDVVRGASHLGSSGPVEPGDVVVYRFVVRNVGLGTAYTMTVSDTLPAGLVTEAGGTYTVSNPSSSGSLGMAGGAASFSTPLNVSLSGGGSLTVMYSARVTSAALQGTPLVNVAHVTGTDALDAPIPASNVAAGDASDDDVEDADADDTGIASIGAVQPALSVDKQVVDVRRGGLSVGVVDPVLYQDVVVYRVAVRNVGLGTAYNVNVADALPTGLVIDTSSPVGTGTYSVSSPSVSGSLGLTDGTTSFATSLGATMAGGATLALTFAARVMPTAAPAVWLVNTASATGRDGAGSAISPANPAVGDTSDDDIEDADADDTGVASVRVGIPALVTEKSIARIVRAGQEAPTTWIEVGDVVTYALVVRNVGQGPALQVALTDTLPTGLSYLGSSRAMWPSGGSTADPSGHPGPILAWTLGATLEPGEQVRLTFEAIVNGPIRQDQTYTNVLAATGRDAAGAPIPLDASELVPQDTDNDDRSAVSLPGAAAALVTGKSVERLLRNGQPLDVTSPIATGDVVTFRLVVANVGRGSAYAVDVRDDLPSPFTYIGASTSGSWPSRPTAYSADPFGTPRLFLEWPTQATLAGGQSIELTFQARMDGPVSPGQVYWNVLSARGLDGVHTPIPANSAAMVPADTDADDADDVILIAAKDVPALVTDKTIVAVHRNGLPILDGIIEQGDVVTYELAVQNVGPATAYSVRLVEELPPEFAYVLASTAGYAPAVFSTADPRMSGSELWFDLDAALERGERAVVRFDALVADAVVDGRSYVNRMRAIGTDSDGAPIPADQHARVPEDDDRDDASSAAVRARSWLLEGAGGLINAPIVRKTAQTLGTGACLGVAAVVDRVWFQTDIAMFAAAEFASFAGSPGAGDVFTDTLLPTWARTVRRDLATYALGNLLQVDVLSSLGVDLAHGPRIVEAGAGVSPDVALARRLAALADLAGLGPDDVVPDSRWVYLEAEAGEPVLRSERDTPWGESGTWTIVDEDLVGSSLGMGLARQAQAANTLTASLDAKERYVGWVLAESMANKLVALDRDLTARPAGGPAYVPHIWKALESPGQFELVDGASVLFDQASLVWGAARVLAFCRAASSRWPASERDLAAGLEAGARTLLGRAAETIATYHIASDGRIVARSPGSPDGAWEDASTVDAALLVLGTAAALAEDAEPAEALRTIQTQALALVLARQGPDGQFASVSTTAGLATDLASQFAGLYALTVAGRMPAAQRTFDFLEREAWDDWHGFGLYRMSDASDADSICYTALDMGFAVGALRAFAARSDASRADLAVARLAAFARTILDDAALELDNVSDASTESLATGSGRRDVVGLRIEDAERTAPVIQRSLCLSDAAAAGACGGVRVVPDDPWYQTDIAMYASYTVQDSDAGREDDADANLAAVDFHSGLGVPFEAYASLVGFASTAAHAVGSSAALTPIVVPFYAGDPHLGGRDSDLGWNPLSFDSRVVPSAVGMTLLREAQEVRQLSLAPTRTPEDALAARVLAALAVGKLTALEDLVLAAPDGTRYMAHAYSAVPGAGDVRMDVVDRTSDLFDQASVLFGLTELARLAREPAASELLSAVAARPDVVVARCEALADLVVGTLERAHYRVQERALADLAAPDAARWVAGDDVSAWRLGMVMMALERARATFGAVYDLAERARRLAVDEAAFVSTALWDGSGGHREVWSARPRATADCATPTVIGQLGALAGLLVADRLSGGWTEEIVSSVLAFDARFWDPALEMYVGRLDHLAWCMTPLDLALIVGIVPQAAAAVGAADAQVLASHVERHVDRALDGVDLQIPPRSLAADGEEETYAPVFDRRVCVEPVAPQDGLTWTRPGDTVRYTVVVENPSPETFHRLTLEDILPAGVRFVSARPSPTSGDGTLRWSFPELAPGSVLSWQIDASVLPTVEPGEALTNCARLTYVDATGTAGPAREACATVEIGDADGARLAGLAKVPLEYRTDEAMRLAVALEDAADFGLLGSAEERARSASRANAGVLLGESGLGVFVPLAPISPAQGADVWAQLARDAGLPGTPTLLAPIVLPGKGGVPILERGVGFAERDLQVTPAALGWTLARESVFLESSDQGELAAYLRGLVSAVVVAQLDWLNRTAGTFGGRTHFVHAVSVQTSSTVATDPRSLAYDQASLLVGLSRIAASRAASEETALRATNLATYVFADLALHVGPGGTVVPTLGAGEAAARFAESVVVARALGEVAHNIPRLAAQARALLATIVGAVRASAATDVHEELARVSLLLTAARVLEDRTLQAEAVEAWKTWAAAARDASGRLAFSAAARVGWRYTPAEAALALETLLDVARTGEALAASTAATDLVLTDVLADHIQLWTPVGYWRDHVGLPCFDVAPVFAVRPGPPTAEPLWTLRRP